jgi:hypothetical protein
MSELIGEQELQALHYVAQGQDPFTGCSANGDFGRRLFTLATLRRICLIDHHDRLTESGRGLLMAITA